MKMLMALAVAGVLMLVAGCGGGSKGGSVAGMPSVQTPTTPPPTVRVASLPVLGEPETPSEEPVVVEIPDNTVRITPGQTREVSVGGRSVSVRCPSGGASCHVGVHEGKLWYRLDGAVPFALASLPPPTPTPPTTPPTRVIEPPPVSLGELPALVDRMTHRTELLGRGFAGASCDDGVTACQAVVKDLLADATQIGPIDGNPPWKALQAELPLPRLALGSWLDNSILIGRVDYDNVEYDKPGSLGTHFLSMGIRDTNPVTGLYSGGAVYRHGYDKGLFYAPRHFELRYRNL